MHVGWAVYMDSPLDISGPQSLIHRVPCTVKSLFTAVSQRLSAKKASNIFLRPAF